MLVVPAQISHTGKVFLVSEFVHISALSRNYRSHVEWAVLSDNFKGLTNISVYSGQHDCNNSHSEIEQINERKYLFSAFESTYCKDTLERTSPENAKAEVGQNP